MKKRIVLLGPPASGKGTQAELIKKQFGIPAPSTGAILRQEAKAGTEVGVAASTIIKPGVGKDDNDSALVRRMREYREKTLPVTDFYERRGILENVDPDREAGFIFLDVSRLITE